MGMAKNIKRTMEDLKKPRPHGPSRSFSSLKLSISPLAWKASLFFWRKWVKKNPPKPHVIKPASSSSSSSAHHRTTCTRSKHVPMPTTYTAKNSNFFYYSYPDHNPNDGKRMYGCCDVVKTKTRPHPPYTACITPTSCDDYSPNLNMNTEYHNPLPYFQLNHSPRVPFTRRLPLYIVS